ncbi:MAG: hypothetical protein LBP89_04560 [Helicobacteraceae bacterium]|nr:hypothetical protein [Helicobacteraceae bacterium]
MELRAFSRPLSIKTDASPVVLLAKAPTLDVIAARTRPFCSVAKRRGN